MGGRGRGAGHWEVEVCREGGFLLLGLRLADTPDHLTLIRPRFSLTLLITCDLLRALKSGGGCHHSAHLGVGKVEFGFIKNS